MLQLLWTAPAIEDRQWIFDFTGIRGAAAAIALDARITERAAQLTGHPRLGRRGRVRGTRELVVDAQYLLVYEVHRDAIVILRLLHARQQWPLA